MTSTSIFIEGLGKTKLTVPNFIGSKNVTGKANAHISVWFHVTNFDQQPERKSNLCISIHFIRVDSFSTSFDFFRTPVNSPMFLDLEQLYSDREFIQLACKGKVKLSFAKQMSSQCQPPALLQQLIVFTFDINQYHIVSFYSGHTYYRDTLICDLYAIFCTCIGVFQ